MVGSTAGSLKALERHNVVRLLVGGLAVLAGPRTVAHGDRDRDVPGSSFRALALGVELLGA